MPNPNPRSYGGGSGTWRYYTVEARSTYSSPCIISENFVLDHAWRVIPNDGDSRFKVPTRTWCPLADHLRLMNLQAAKAFAELFLAEAHACLVAGSGCIECRIVEVELVHSYSTKEIGVGEIINRTDGPRPEFKPRETESIALSAREEAKK